MEISYLTKELRALCEISEEAEKVFGLDVARSLRNRLSDITAVDRITDLPIGLSKEVLQDCNGNLPINLKNRLEIVITPNHVKIPYDDAGNLDWVKVFRIKIISIGGKDDFN